MALFGKIEADVEIKSAAHKFHDVVCCRPYHVSKITPEKVQGCDLHEGKWGNAGSIICWRYVHEGKAKICKQIIEAVDDMKNSTTHKVIEGDLLELYKSFTIIVEATPKEGGSLVHWTLEYEKLNEDVPDPNSFLEYLCGVSTEIDGHLQEQS